MIKKSINVILGIIALLYIVVSCAMLVGREKHDQTNYKMKDSEFVGITYAWEPRITVSDCNNWPGANGRTAIGTVSQKKPGYQAWFNYCVWR